MMLPVPGKVLKTVLIVLFATWLVFALAINWGGAAGNTYAALKGNAFAIANGEVWRLFTALVIHETHGSIGHLLGTMIGLYFLGSSLEESWGGKRFAKFLAWSGVLAYGTQVLLLLAAPALAAKFAPAEFYGASPVVYAVAMAWAFSFKGRTVSLMFVLPVSSKALVYIVVGLALMTVIAGGMSPSGHIAIFAGMGYGWLLGGGTPSPLKKGILKYRLAALEREAQAERQSKKKKVKQSGLTVLKGGKNSDKDPPGGMLH